MEELNIEVSLWGDIINMKTGKSLKHQKCKNGYHRVYLTIEGKRKSFSVHRLVALAYIPNPANKPDVNHMDGNKSNNAKSNLEWVTKSENQKHAYRNGLFKTKMESNPERERMFLRERQKRFHAKKKD